MARDCIFSIALSCILFSAVSCASVRQTEFTISAIDTDERDVTCVIFSDEQILVNNSSNEPIRTPANIKVIFKPKSDGSGFESVKLGLKAVEVGPDKKIIKGLREGEGSRFLEDVRWVQPTDAKNQTFILLKDKNYN